jgi:lipid-A-disaccharide synthase
MTSDPSSQASLPEDGAPLIYLVAGEPSGDQLGARLMAALREESGGAVRFAGVGGERMVAEGLDPLFPLAEVAVFGLAETIPHIARIRRRIMETIGAIKACQPAVLVTIDSPGFTLEISQRLADQDFPLVHLVAPQVWAWKPWRARRMARYLDHLLALLPFEPPVFERHGLATTFIGHPVVEASGLARDPADFRARHGIPAEAPLLCLLPGSRRGEVRRLLPVFARTVALLRQRRPDLWVVAPTVANVADKVIRKTQRWPIPALVLPETAEKYQAFAAADVALAASGTVALELAVAELPAVIAYRVNPVSALLARPMLKVKFVSLVNLVTGRSVQPEYLQHRCTPERLVRALEHLLSDAAARADQVAGYREVTGQLKSGEIPPSRQAARKILALAGTRARAAPAGPGATAKASG